MSPQARITHALSIAVESAGVDGAHHKQWVIDQMVRALTGCPEVPLMAVDNDGQTYPTVSKVQGESEEYRAFVRIYNADVQYDAWNVGIAP